VSIPLDHALLAAIAALDRVIGGTSARKAALALGVPLNTAADYLRRARGKDMRRYKKCRICQRPIERVKVGVECEDCKGTVEGIRRAREWWMRFETILPHLEVERRVRVLAERARKGLPLFEGDTK
jgi:hypothetical protein